MAPPSPAGDSDAILAAARASLARQRAGGRSAGAPRGGSLLERLRRVFRDMLNPPPPVPTREALPQSGLTDLAGQVERWLRAQRRQLPAPAAQAIDRIGARLAVLNAELVRLGEDQPAAAQVRRLIGEDLPALVAAYTEIPAPLRADDRAGVSPDRHLAESLARIDAEIDSVTRQLAEGAIDRLAIQSRYLDLKYGEGAGQGG